MVKILYCDRCGKRICSGKDEFEGFDVEFRSFGGHYPQLCSICETKFKKVINEFLNEYHNHFDGQPSWEQEWEDFGEVYDDEPAYI